MFISRGNCGICVRALALALALVGAGWAQTNKPTSPDHAILYRRAVTFLDLAQQKLNAGDFAGAKSLVKQSNSLFTLLKQEYATVLAERELFPQEDQQLAINQKLADDTHALTYRCCGSFLSAIDPEMVTPLVQEIIGSAAAAQADCLVTACAMCQLNLEIPNTSRAKIPIFHFSEILALALGADDHEEWFIRHLVDPRPVIQKLSKAA